MSFFNAAEETLSRHVEPTNLLIVDLRLDRDQMSLFNRIVKLGLLREVNLALVCRVVPCAESVLRGLLGCL